MPHSPSDMFYLLSDLSDAFADLSIAMKKWHKEQEVALSEPENESLLASFQELQSVFETIKRL